MNVDLGNSNMESCHVRNATIFTVDTFEPLNNNPIHTNEKFVKVH